MVRLLGFATLAIALISTTDVLAHPHHRVSKHRAIARRASHPLKRAGTKAEACAARDAERAKTSLSASGTASLTATSTTSGTSTASPSTTPKDDANKGTTTPGSLLAVLPPAGIRDGWTLAGPDSADVKSLVLSDDIFDISKEIKDLPHDVVSLDGKKAIHGHMEKGELSCGSEGSSFGFNALLRVVKGAVALNPSPLGGFSFYTPGPKDSKLDLTKAREISFGYSVKFSKGYAFNKGGKLPGVCEFQDNGARVVLICEDCRRRC